MKIDYDRNDNYNLNKKYFVLFVKIGENEEGNSELSHAGIEFSE